MSLEIMDKYYVDYQTDNQTNDNEMINNGSRYNGDYLYPHEGRIYIYREYPYDSRFYDYSTYSYMSPNETEQAYNILKALVEKKVISTPKSFKKFCELIDSIKEAI